jgi:hypothetical protein
MKKTAIEQAIEAIQKRTEYDKAINSGGKFNTVVFNERTDVIAILQSLLPTECKQIEEAHVKGQKEVLEYHMLASTSKLLVQNASQYFETMFKK